MGNTKKEEKKQKTLLTLSRSFWCILAVGVILSAAIELIFPYSSDQSDSERKSIPFGVYGEGSYTISLAIRGLTDEEENLLLEIPEYQPEENEKLKYLNSVFEKLSEELRQDSNPVLQVEDSVTLPQNYQGTSIQWSSLEPDLMDDFGNRTSEEEGEVRMRAVLKYGDASLTRYLIIQTKNPVFTEEEKLIRAWMSSFEEELKKAEKSEEVELPKEVLGKMLYYPVENKENLALKILFGTVLTAVCMELIGREQRKEELRKRQDLLQEDYPEIVHRMIIFMRSGLSIEQSFLRVAEAASDRPAYQEWKKTAAEMAAGVPTGQALGSLGIRCNLAGYHRLISLLDRNRRRGGREILALMELELQSALEEKKNLSRKNGAKLETRLLIPGMGILAILLLILMVPMFGAAL